MCRRQNVTERRTEMTPEQRFDRLERIVKLMVKAGPRARSQMREQGERINVIIDFQMQNEEKFGRNEERFARNEERIAKLVEAQVHTGSYRPAIRCAD